jgi:hypothetical protein
MNKSAINRARPRIRAGTIRAGDCAVCGRSKAMVARA